MFWILLNSTVCICCMCMLYIDTGWKKCLQTLSDGWVMPMAGLGCYSPMWRLGSLLRRHGSSLPDGALMLAVRELRSVSVIFRDTSVAVPTFSWDVLIESSPWIDKKMGQTDTETNGEKKWREERKKRGQLWKKTTKFDKYTQYSTLNLSIIYSTFSTFSVAVICTIIVYCSPLLSLHFELKSLKGLSLKQNLILL